MTFIESLVGLAFHRNTIACQFIETLSLDTHFQEENPQVIPTIIREM